MGEIKDMQMSKKEAKKDGGMVIGRSAEKLPKYPYGLKLNLDTATIKKLGISDLAVGDYVKVVAQACIVGKDERERQGGEAEITMDVQLEKMGISKLEKASDINEWMKTRQKGAK